MTENNVNKRKVVGISLVIILIIAILIITLYKKPQQELAEQPNLNQIEKVIEKENSKEKLDKEIEKAREDMEKVIQRTEESNKIKSESKVPVPETKIVKDEGGNKITVTKVPEINPNSSPEDVEKPTKPEPKPTELPKTEGDIKDPSKPPTTVKSEENSNKNENTTKPSSPNKSTTKPNDPTPKPGNDNNATKKEEVYNPFTDPNRAPSTPTTFYTEEGEMGDGDKF